MRGVLSRGFQIGIKNAWYKPFRIDEKDYIGGITDEMIREITRSRFLIADYTFNRDNVYFEAEFALGLGLTVFQPCRQSEEGKLHFDIRHLNTLIWSDPADLAPKLERPIVAVLGRGPLLGNSGNS